MRGGIHLTAIQRITFAEVTDAFANEHLDSRQLLSLNGWWGLHKCLLRFTYRLLGEK
jgi:hypothetical protein